jgi:lipopolysaccharide heptosyltransferase I
MAVAKILIVRLSALGDVLFTLPAVEALLRHRPDLEVDWLVEDKAETILDLYPRVRRRIVYPRRLLAGPLASPSRLVRSAVTASRHLRSLRSGRYDLILDFQGNLKSGVHVLAARAARKAGFGPRDSREGSHWFYGERITPDPGVHHRIDKALALVRGLFPGVPEAAPRPELVIPEASRTFAARFLDRLEGPGAEGPVILHPGTSQFGAFKRWRPERFAELGDRLAREGHRVLITWGPGEYDLASALQRTMKSAQPVLAPRTGSLADLAALVARARLFVGSDSAPLHLAAFLGTPVVALFGPKDPARYGPRFAARRVVRAHVPCSPCTRRTCPDTLCMEELRVRQVFEAATALLEESAAA